MLLENGHLQPLTETGRFTITRLRLDRVALVKHRIQKQQQKQRQKELEQYAELLSVQRQLNQQLSVLVQEQNDLLKTYQQLLEMLIERK